MAIFRNIQMSFWTDTKVSEDFDPEERYMYLYLLTNPYTNLCGCYGIGYKQIAYDTGIELRKVKSIIKQLQDKHGILCYSEENREVLILNWHKYNWTESEKFRKPLLAQIEVVKTQSYKEYLMGLYNGTDMVQIPYSYGMDTTDTVTDTDTITVEDTQAPEDKKDKKPTLMPSVRIIINHLNEKAGTRYMASSKATVDLIKARLKDFTVEDHIKVIDNMVDAWKGDPKMEEYLRPSTLFAPSHFEEYLNRKPKVRVVNKFQNFPARDDAEHKDMVAKLIAMQTGG